MLQEHKPWQAPSSSKYFWNNVLEWKKNTAYEMKYLWVAL